MSKITKSRLFELLSARHLNNPYSKLADLPSPEKFKDIDIEDEGNDIMKKFLGVDGVYTAYMNDIQFPNAQQV